jgi:WD40 repeat protein
MARVAIALFAVLALPALARSAEPPLPPGAVARLGSTKFLHPHPVSHVLFAPDGKRVGTLGGGQLLWWNADGTVAAEPFKEGILRPVSPILSADNSTLVSIGYGCLSAGLSALDPNTGKVRSEQLAICAEGLGHLRVSHNGKWAVGLHGKTVVVWNLEKGKKASSFDVEGVVNVAVSNDGKLVAAHVQHFKTQVRAADTGKLVAEFKVELEIHNDIAFSPDGKFLATVGTGIAPGAPSPAPVRLWDIGQKKEVWALSLIRPGFMIGRALAFSPNGKYVTVFTREVLVIDAATGKLVAEIDPGDGATGQYSVSPDGTRLACATGHRFRLWELPSGKDLNLTPGPRSGFRLIERSPDGKLIATASLGGPVWLWDGATGAPVRAVDAHPDRIEFSADARKLLTVQHNNEPVRVWDAVTGKMLYSVGGSGWMMARGTFTEHGLFCFTHYTPSLHDPETGKAIWTGKAVAKKNKESLEEPHVAVSPTRKLFATRGKLSEVKTGDVHAPTAAGEPLVLSADGKRVVHWDEFGVRVCARDLVAEKDGPAVKVPFFNVFNRSEDRPVVAFSPTATHVAGANYRFRLTVVDLMSGKETPYPEPPPDVPAEQWAIGWCRGAAFSPDGKWLAGFGGGAGVAVWDVATGKRVAWLEPAPALPCTCVSFAADGKTLLSGHGNGDFVFVWNLENAPAK